MPATRTHPPIDMPSVEQLHEIVARSHPRHAELYVAAHRMVVAAIPGIRFAVDEGDGAVAYGVRQFGYGGWGMAALSPYRGWVSLFFMRGATLLDPGHLLEGRGKVMRHAKLRSVEDLAAKAPGLRSLLEAAGAAGGASAPNAAASVTGASGGRPR